MNNKTKILIAFLIVFAFLVFGCSSSIDIESINDCDSDSDCIMVDGGCGRGPESINKDHIEKWESYLEKYESEHKDALCKMTLLLDDFVAKCLDKKCVAVQKETL